MAYIGKTPVIGNFQVCDAISVVNNQAAYTMQVSSVNVSPETANHMLVSLNGILQAPTSSFTVSGSTITFASNLVTGDVIDFIQILGNVLDLGVPSDGTVTSAKITYPLTTFSSTGIDDNADATAITINSSENVGIGETVPLGKLHIKTGDSGQGTAQGEADELVIEGSGNAGINILSGDSNLSMISFGDSADANVGFIHYNHSNNAMTFRTNASDSMLIDSSGRVIIPIVGSNPSVLGALSLKVDGGTYVGISMQKSDADNLGAMRYYNSSGTEVGSIVVTESATSFNTSSDYRLKENVVEIINATERLKQLQPKRFNFISDADTTVDGFLAHEVSSVVPEAISGTHNATETKEKVVVNANGNVIAQNIEQADWETGKIADENGNTQYPTDSTWEATKVVPVYQGIDQSKLVPLLVKTIQELEARITALENA
jgi:hypothetical protein